MKSGIRKSLSLGKCILFLFLFAAVSGFQLLSHKEMLDGMKEWEGTCTKTKFVEKGQEIRLVLQCADREAYTTQRPIIVAMAEKDQPISCQVFHSGEATCTPPTN